MVPKDWEIKRFEEVAYVGNGQVDPREEPYLSMLHIGPENISSDSGKLSEVKRCSELKLISGKYEFDKNSIVYSKIRPNLNKICRPNFNGVCSADMYPIWAKEDLNIDYLFYYMLGENFYKTAVSMSMRTGMPKINRTDLDAININIPPLPEQQKIAKILATWDKAIDTTERLIENSKQQKKALMQQLLTGQKRLLDGSGQRFSGDWDICDLNKICKINKGKQRNRSTLFESGAYPVINGGISPSGYTDEYNTNSNTITISEGGNSCGFVNLLSEPFWCGGHCYALIDVKIDNKYLYHFLKHIEREIMSLRVGSGLPNIQKKDIEKVKVQVPSQAEQQKIASVLTNADREIEVLEQQLADLQQEKKALMQQLLTGKKRVNV